MERDRDKPQLVRVGSLIRYNHDGDIGIVTEVMTPLQDTQLLKVWWSGQLLKVWWLRENRIGRKTGAIQHDFEPSKGSEVLMNDFKVGDLCGYKRQAVNKKNFKIFVIIKTLPVIDKIVLYDIEEQETVSHSFYIFSHLYIRLPDSVRSTIVKPSVMVISP